MNQLDNLHAVKSCLCRPLPEELIWPELHTHLEGSTCNMDLYIEVLHIAAEVRLITGAAVHW